jgi:hypothetical protein
MDEVPNQSHIDGWSCYTGTFYTFIDELLVQIGFSPGILAVITLPHQQKAALLLDKHGKS